MTARTINGKTYQTAQDALKDSVILNRLGIVPKSIFIRRWQTTTPNDKLFNQTVNRHKIVKRIFDGVPYGTATLALKNAKIKSRLIATNVPQSTFIARWKDLAISNDDLFTPVEHGRPFLTRTINGVVYVNPYDAMRDLDIKERMRIQKITKKVFIERWENRNVSKAELFAPLESVRHFKERIIDGKTFYSARNALDNPAIAMKLQNAGISQSAFVRRWQKAVDNDTLFMPMKRTRRKTVPAKYNGKWYPSTQDAYLAYCFEHKDHISQANFIKSDLVERKTK